MLQDRSLESVSGAPGRALRRARPDGRDARSTCPSPTPPWHPPWNTRLPRRDPRLPRPRTRPLYLRLGDERRTSVSSALEVLVAEAQIESFSTRARIAALLTPILRVRSKEASAILQCSRRAGERFFIASVEVEVAHHLGDRAGLRRSPRQADGPAGWPSVPTTSGATARRRRHLGGGLVPRRASPPAPGLRRSIASDRLRPGSRPACPSVPTIRQRPGLRSPKPAGHRLAGATLARATFAVEYCSTSSGTVSIRSMICTRPCEAVLFRSGGERGRATGSGRRRS